MPFPLNPPPASDYGAFTIPRMLQRWLDVNPVSKLTRTQAYITLPAFSVGNTWLGYSDIIASFNYEGPNNFTLVGFNVEPLVNPNYCLCIMWKDQYGNVNRYSLWRGVGEVIYLNVPMYSGQKIAKNFRFEIWSTNSTPLVQVTPIQIYTSVLGGIDYRFGSDFQLVNNDPIVTAFSVGVVTPVTSPPTGGLIAHWRADSYFGFAWADLVVGYTLNVAGTVPQVNNPLYINNATYLDFTNGSMSNAGYGPVINAPITNDAQVFIVCAKANAGSAALLSMTDSTSTSVVTINQVRNINGWIINGENLTDTTALTLPNFIGIQAFSIQGTLVGLEQFNPISNVAITNPGTNIENLIIPQGDNYIAEILIYSQFNSDADVAQFKQYLASRYGSSILFSLPLVFPSNSSPTQNEVIQP